MSNSGADSLIDITVNGEPRQAPRGSNVLGLLNALGVVPDRVAVELNREIIRRAQWESTPVEPGAQVEIVQFVGGGK